MATMILDPNLAERLKAERALSGADRFDEVWEGTYVMSPLANNEHQLLVSKLTSVLELVIGSAKLGEVYAGVNVSDRTENWEHNFRCPDVAVFLSSTTAVDCGTFWHGGPNLAIEVVSPGDQTRQKLDFYASVNTGELLIIDREPWQLELYRLAGKSLELVGTSNLNSAFTLTCEATGVTFELQFEPNKDRPKLIVRHPESNRVWTI